MISNNLLSCNFFVQKNANFKEVVNVLTQKHPQLNLNTVVQSLKLNESRNLKQIFYTKEYKLSYKAEKPRLNLKRSRIELFNKK